MLIICYFFLSFETKQNKKKISGLSAGLQTKGSPVPFPVRAHAWVVGQVPSRGALGGATTHQRFSSSLSPSLPLSKNK